MDTSPDDTVVGNEEEWTKFSTRHPHFLEESHRLVDLANAVLNRKLDDASKEQFLFFGFGFLILDDFQDIVILVGNGRGFGAQKLLRGMYERITTLAYLMKHPERAIDFIDYDRVRLYKIYQELGAVLPSAKVSQELVDLKAARDEAMKNGRFSRNCKCKTDCDARLPAISWTPLAVPELAAAANDGLRQDLLAAYVTPLSETHPSFLAAVARQSITQTGSTFAAMDTKSREVADVVLFHAHKYALALLALHIEHFPELAHLSASLAERTEAFTRLFADRPSPHASEA